MLNLGKIFTLRFRPSSSRELARDLWTWILIIHILVFSGNLFLKQMLKKWPLSYRCPAYCLYQMYLTYTLGLPILMLMYWNFLFHYDSIVTLMPVCHSVFFFFFWQMRLLDSTCSREFLLPSWTSAIMFSLFYIFL